MGCDLVGAKRETCKMFFSAKRKHLEKTNRRAQGGKIYLNILGSSKGNSGPDPNAENRVKKAGLCGATG